MIFFVANRKRRENKVVFLADLNDMPLNSAEASRQSVLDVAPMKKAKIDVNNTKCELPNSNYNDGRPKKIVTKSSLRIKPAHTVTFSALRSMDSGLIYELVQIKQEITHTAFIVPKSSQALYRTEPHGDPRKKE